MGAVLESTWALANGIESHERHVRIIIDDANPKQV